MKTPDREARGFSFVLERAASRGGERLELRALHRASYGAISADWTGPELARRIGGGRRQPMARAVGLHRRKPGDAPLRVLDATAGLGRDGYTLAALGAVVTLAERQPETCALLADARLRALALAAHEAAASRVEIVNADARALCLDPANAGRWDVIYLDPMYPDDGKAALPSKEMQILRDLTGGDDDADELLAPALACAGQRVVVKRPAKAPCMAGVEPTMRIEGTQLRFDVYVRAALAGAAGESACGSRT
ncbi:MAG: class I SAM-dependent methyltransferase [Nevskia sp.]